jgi:hypothetical protein
MTPFEARITTDRAARYLTQLCRHAAAMGSRPRRLGLHARGTDQRRLSVQAEWDDRHAVLTFDPPVRATLDAGPTALTVRIDADDDRTAVLVRDILTRDLQRFGRRDRLTVDWHPISQQGAQ